MSEAILRTAPVRQLRLFDLDNPLTARFGNAFFRSLPEGPGVYFFHGSEGQLLYIGQSSNLRARLGSYRHVSEGRHPRRTLRLVARVTKIEWQECLSAAEAIEKESALLLEHRPPFNRAGVWKGDPWWLAMEMETDQLTLRLQREATPGSLGPLPPASRHRLSTIVRALPRECRFPAPYPQAFIKSLTAALGGDLTALLHDLSNLPPAPTLTEQTFWQEEQETLAKLCR